MKFTLSLLLIVTSTISVFAQAISGIIKDEHAHPIPFATIYVKNTTTGTSANIEGEYSLQLKPGKYDVQFKAIGYKPEDRQLDVKANQIINITLAAESYQLQEVIIGGNGEDPAYAIIRKAIKKRKTYLNEVKAYTTDVYIKGLQRLLGAPKKFLGQDIDALGREIGLDANRAGIIYLSESESKFSYQYPNNVREEMISSKVSGRNRAFSFNRASELNTNFYENFESWGDLSNRPLISPIADNALFYYNYRLLGETTENGETINKIQVTPKRAHDPCFSGIIYILKGSWRLYSVDLYITKGSNINFVDTLKVNQQFVPVNNNIWMPSAMNMAFNGSFLGFKFGGYFIAIYKNYDLNPTFGKKDFAEVLRITKEVNKKDSLYWSEERPIPLTAEERNDYLRKGRMEQRRESRPYLDSLDRRNNKITPSKILLSGVNIRNRYQRKSYHFDGLLRTLQYNTVEGFAINYDASYTKQIDTLNNRSLYLGANFRYGFANRLFNANVNTSVPVFGSYTLNISGGSDVVDVNKTQTLTPLLNSAYSLLSRENFQKLYQKQFVHVGMTGRIAGGLRGSAGIEWANRKWLPNAASYSIFSPAGHQFTSNNPFTPTIDAPLFPENKALTLTLRATYDFSNKYATYPAGKRYLPSKYPTVGISYIKGINGVLGSSVDYDLLSVDISKNNINMGMYGQTSFYVSAGKFINATNLYYTDYKQFAGNKTLFYQAGISRFLLLDFYLFSTNKQYLEAHLEHNFSGFILNKIPLIRKLKLQEIADINYLTTPTFKNYTELGLGVQFFGIRAMYARSFNSGSNVNSAIRLRIPLF